MISHRLTRLLTGFLVVCTLVAGYAVATTLAQATDATATLTAGTGTTDTTPTTTTTPPTTPTISTPTDTTPPYTIPTPTTPTTPIDPVLPPVGAVCTSFVTTSVKIGQVRVSKKIRGRLAVSSIKKNKTQVRLMASRTSPKGKTLTAKTWKSVTYFVGGKKVGKSRKRPFSVKVKLAALKTGRHKAYIKVGYAHGRTTKTNFKLTILPRTSTSKVCVLKVK